MSQILLAWRLATLAPKPSGKKTSLAFSRARLQGIDGLRAQTVSLVRVHSLRPSLVLLLYLWVALILPCHLPAATFPGNARVQIGDSAGALTVSNSQFSVSCWFRISIPSGTNLTENMVLLANRPGGLDSDADAYLIRFNLSSGNVEFVARGSAAFTNTLIAQPYLERWYHVAVTRRNSHYKGFLDGRKVFDTTYDVGSLSNPGGVSIGGLGSGRYFFGDIQEGVRLQPRRDGRVRTPSRACLVRTWRGRLSQQATVICCWSECSASCKTCGVA